MFRHQLAVFIFIGLLSSKFAFGNEIVISGVYLGKNIYIENPPCGANTEFTTQYVYVNGKLKISNPTTSTFEVDLSEFPLNSSIEIRIVFDNNCPPQLINPQVIKPKSSFNFEKISLTGDSLQWQTSGEEGIQKFLVERRIKNDWLIVQSCDGKGNEHDSYSLNIMESPGANQYRLKYIDKDGKSFFSGVATYISNKSSVTMNDR